jgi:hypothetical protein
MASVAAEQPGRELPWRPALARLGMMAVVLAALYGLWEGFKWFGERTGLQIGTFVVDDKTFPHLHDIVGQGDGEAAELRHQAAAVAPEELPAQTRFQLRERPADGRLRDTQAMRGGRRLARGHEGPEHLQFPQGDARIERGTARPCHVIRLCA